MLSVYSEEPHSAPSPLNVGALINAISSPCKRCYKINEDKSFCYDDCKRIQRFNGYLEAFEAWSLGAFGIAEDRMSELYGFNWEKPTGGTL